MAVTKDQLVIEISANNDEAVAGIEQVITKATNLQDVTVALSSSYLKMVEQVAATSKVSVSSIQGEIDVIKLLGNEFDKVTANRISAARALEAAQAVVNDLSAVGVVNPTAEKNVSDARQASIMAEIEARKLVAKSIEDMGATKHRLDVDELQRQGKLAEAVQMQADAELRAFDERTAGLQSLGLLREGDIKLIEETRAAMQRAAAGKIDGINADEAVKRNAIVKAGVDAEMQALAQKNNLLKQVGTQAEALQLAELRRKGKLVDAIKLENQIELRAFDEKVKGLQSVGKLREDEIKLIDRTRAALIKEQDAKVSDAGKSAPKQGGDFSSSFLKVGAVIGTATAAFYGFKKIFDATVGEFNKAQDEVTKLSNALRIMGEGDVQGSVERFSNLAKAMQDTTTITDEHVMSLASIGVAAGKTDNQIEKLIKASVDLAAATGRDVDSTYQALLNTYKGVSRGITDIVPELQGMTAAQLRNGEAVDYVAQKMAGFGEAMATTFAGKIEQSKNILSDIAESLGETITAGFDLDGASANFVTGLKEIRNYLQENGAAIAGIIAEMRQSFDNFINFVLAGFGAIGSSITAVLAGFSKVAEFVGMPTSVTEKLSSAHDVLIKKTKDWWTGIKDVSKAGQAAFEKYNKEADKAASAGEKKSGRPKPPAMVSPEARGQLQELIKLRSQLDLQAKHADDNQIQAIYTKAAAEKLQVDEIKRKVIAEGAYGAKAKENYDAIISLIDARAKGEADKKRLDALNKEREITERMIAVSQAAGATQAAQIATVRDAQVVQINQKEDEARRNGLITEELMKQYGIQRDIAGKVYDDQIKQLAKQRTFMGGMIDDAREFVSLMGAATGVLAKEAGDGLEKSLTAAIAAARNLLDIKAPAKEEAGPPKSASQTEVDKGFISNTIGKATEQWGVFSGKIAAAQEQSLSANMGAISDGLMEAGGALGSAAMGMIGMVAKAPAMILGAIDSITGVIQDLMDFPSKLIDALSNLDQLLTKAIDNLPGAIDKMLEKLPALLVSIVKKIPDFIVMLAEKIPEIIEVLAETLPELVGIILSKLPAIASAVAKGMAKAFWGMITGLIKGIGNAFKGIKIPPLVDTQKIGKDLGKEIKKLTGAASKLFDVTDMGKAAKNSFGGTADIGKQIAQATAKAGMDLSKGWKAMMTMLGDTWHTALEAMNVAVDFFKKAGEIVGRVMSGVFKTIWDTGRALFDNVAAIFSTLWNAAKNVFSVITDAFASVWDVGKELFASVGGVFGAIWEAGRAIFDAAANVFQAVWNVLASVFDGWQATQSALIDLWRALYDGVATIFNSAWSVGQALFEHVAEIFKSVWEVGRILFDAVAKVFDIAWQAGSKVVGLFSDGFKAIWNGFNAVWSMFWNGFQDIWNLGEQAFISIKKILDPLTGSLGDWFDKTVKFFKDLDLASMGTKLWEGIKKGLDGATSIFTNLGTKIWDGLKGGLDNASNVLSRMFRFDGGGKGVVENFIGLDFPFVAFSKGGVVPGAPAVSGDSMANDTVPALLSPGEVVLPRSAMGDEAFRRIVMMKLAGQEIPQFAMGGWVGQAATKVSNEGKKAIDSGGELLNKVADIVIPDWIKSLFDSVKRFVPDIDIGNLVKNPGEAITNALKGVVNSTLAPFIKQVMQRPTGFADGGIVGGMGSGDTVPAMLTPGEFVLRKSAVDNLGVPTLNALNAGASLSSGGGGSNIVNVTMNIEARQNIDEAFIRQRVIPVIKDEFKRSSLDGRAIVYASGVRK